MYILSLHFPLFFYSATPPTEIYTLSLHDALPIWAVAHQATSLHDVPEIGHRRQPVLDGQLSHALSRSEEHTSELQSHHDLVCRLLLEKKNSSENILPLFPALFSQ